MVKVVELKKDGENWVYKLEDANEQSVDSGKFFPETALTLSNRT